MISERYFVAGLNYGRRKGRQGLGQDEAEGGVALRQGGTPVPCGKDPPSSQEQEFRNRQVSHQNTCT